MSAANYNMASSWTDSYVPPQLEQEYLDNSLYGGLTSDSSASYGRRQQPPVSHQQSNGSTSLSGFDSTFPPSMDDFTFTLRQPSGQTQSMTNGMPYLTADAQMQRQYSQQGSIFPSPPSATIQDPLVVGSSLTPGYGSYPGQVQGMRSGPSTPAPSGYSAPNSDNGFGGPQLFNGAYPPEQLQVNTNGLQQTIFDGGHQGTYNGPAFKRMRPAVEQSYGPEDDAEVEEGGAPNGDVAKKALGACSRCKGLKVRCEFKTDPDTCKRCLNGGHVCVIPGRKKRRPPPKREHLLTQIREQAEEIKRLMGLLEEAKRAEATHAVDAPSPSSHSTTTESYSLISSRLGSPEVEAEADSMHISQVHKTNADVQDWIAKARASIEAFGGFINMGGPSASSSDDPDESGEVDIAVELDENEDEFEGGASADEGSIVTSRRGRGGSATPENKHSIPASAAPFGLMAQLSLTKDRSLRKTPSKSDLGEDEDDVGLANDDYFRSSSTFVPRILSENHQVPHILRLGIVTPVDVEKLFKIYYDYMNLSLSLLDPELYSAQKTYWRSPFLFTVICGIASRFYTERPELYPQAIRYAQLAAGTALIGGHKSVEIVHAYILLALYPLPARKWEDDRSWIYLGVAIRIAMDLNLHRPITAKPQNEAHARELLNRTRAWLNCFNLDRSTGSQYGKPPIISNTDYTANRCDQWWNSSPYNMKGFDIHTAAYNADLTVLARFRAEIHSDPSTPTGFNRKLDVAALASRYDDELARLWETWTARLQEHDDPNDSQCNFRACLLRLAYSYARMNVLSFGFQYAFGKESRAVGQDMDLLNRCLRAATDVVHAVLDGVAPHQRIFLRHGPEAQSVFVTFACAFLIKLLHPQYDTYLSRQMRSEIRDLVQRTADLLGSPEVAIDDRHGPKLYARFLEGLLSTPAASLDRPSSDKRKAKSESPVANNKLELSELTKLPKSLSQPPSARPSAEPEEQPAGPTMYAQHLTADPHQMQEVENNSYMIQPLPFEELLQSMQSVTDSSSWGDFGAMPGFAWMGQNNADITMSYVPAMQQP